MISTGPFSICSIDLCCGRLITVVIPRTCGYVNYTVKGVLQTWWRVSRWGSTPGLYEAGLKLNIQKTKIMASGFITSWQINGETTETETLFLGGSRITADGDCSHEIKRRLLLGRKIMNNLDSVFKSRDITLQTKVRLVKAMVFPVVMYGCESIKKAEHQRTDAFELWC